MSVLPSHSQDSPVINKRVTVSIPDPSATSPRSPRSAFFRSPPQTARTGVSALTGVSAHTGFSARTWRTGISTQSIAAETLDIVVVKLEQETEATKELFDLHESDDGSSIEDEKHPHSWLQKMKHFRKRLRHFLHQPAFHYTVIGMVMLDLVIVFVDLVVSLLNLPCFSEGQLEKFRELGVDDPPESPICILHESLGLQVADWFLWGISVFFLSCFMLEIVASLFAFGPRHFKKPLYAIDGIVVAASFILELVFKLANSGKLESSPSALIVLRLWKIVRAIHAIAHSIELRNQTIINEVNLAKAQVEGEHQAAANALYREQIRVQYLRAKAPEVQDVELEDHVDRELERLQEGEKAENVEDEKRVLTA